jgi:hypothetical protein
VSSSSAPPAASASSSCASTARPATPSSPPRATTPACALEALGAKALKLDVTDPASISGLGWQLDGEKIDVALYVAGVYVARRRHPAAGARRVRPA